jgi:alginate O-acetyltransferase complex protein AlgI
MLFNSFQFLIFFIIVTTVYFAFHYKYRWLLLLTASCYFYMAFVPVYIFILGGTIVIDYIAGILIEQHTGRKRKIILITSLISNIGVLAVFKYYNFLIENITVLLDAIGLPPSLPYLSILLPIGLSFHTFQAMSYTIEVYRGNQKAERHFGIYALYVMFYPQLVAGPIERPQNMLHQFHEQHSFNYENVSNGLKLMAWGFFKKVVIADRLSLFVNQVYDNPTAYEGIPLIVATLFFTFQIYCDFSGYSDIALGSAQVMGFKLMQNFNRPYFSKSISEFWSRWHISLSTWFKDYLYIPLGGNRTVKWRWYYNLLITFLISGLWHGAKWTFICWGFLHGIYLIVAIITKPFRELVNRKTGLEKSPHLFTGVQVIVTFCLVSFTWIFFRANSFHDAAYIASHLFTNLQHQFSEIFHNQQYERTQLVYLGQSSYTFLIAILSIILMELIHFTQRNKNIRAIISDQPVIVRWSIYIAGIISILWFGVFDNTQFIYFQF